MKKFIIAALAISVLATSMPAMAAPGRGGDRYEHQDRRGRDHRDESRFDRDRRNVVVRRQVVTRVVPAPRPAYHVWHRGERFDHRHAPRYVVINNPRHYHLHDAPRGYRWVRSGNDAVLVGLATGIVAAVVTSALIN